MRLVLLIITAAVCTACSTPRAPAAPTTPTPTRTAAPTATPRPAVPTATLTPREPTNTPPPDYRGMRTRLLTPLGAMIIAVRGNNRPQAAAHLANFNHVADEVLPVIERDLSKQANALHSTIMNVRSHPGDLAALEQERRSLLAAIP